MLFSLALIFIVGITLGAIVTKLKLPRLVGLLITGIVLSPYMLDLISDDILNISTNLREIALVIILIKAGLSLNINDLRKVGRPAVLMSFLPATFEICAVVILAPLLFGMSVIEACVLGAVLGAVSPAVIVPKMVELMERGYGKEKSLPQLVLAAASIDDIFVIVIFTSFLGLSQGEELSAISFIKIPVSIIMGVIIGVIGGFVLVKLFKRIHLRDSVKVLLVLSVSFLSLCVEDMGNGFVSGLVGVMVISMVIKFKDDSVSTRLSEKFSKLWVCAEIVLFVLVGATVNLEYISSSGVKAVILIVLAISVRMVGVFVCLLGTKLNLKERLFCMISFTPKATVQAAIGGIPLSLGLACGNTVLTVAVLAILITAPVGAFCIDLYTKNTCGEH